MSLTTGDGIAGRILAATPLTLVCPACIFGVTMAGSAPPGPSPPDPQTTAGIAVFAFGFHPSGFFPLGCPRCSASARKWMCFLILASFGRNSLCLNRHSGVTQIRHRWLMQHTSSSARSLFLSAPSGMGLRADHSESELELESESRLPFPFPLPLSLPLPLPFSLGAEPLLGDQPRVFPVRFSALG